MASQFPPKKNTAFNLGLCLYKTDGTLIANPGTVTAKISKDFGDYADIGTVTEEDSTYGQLKLALTTTEMNADVVMIYVVDNTSGCVPFTCTIYTAANLLDDIKTETAAIVADTNELQTDWVNGGRLDLILDIIAADTTTDIPATITTLQGNVTDILTDTGTTLDTLIKDIPTVAEFEARTIAAADYTIVTDLGVVQTGDSFAIVNNASKGLVKVYDDMSKPATAQAITAPADMALNSTVAKETTLAGVDTVVDLIEDIVRNRMEITDATGAVVLRADDNSTSLLTGSVTDNSTTTIRARLA